MKTRNAAVCLMIAILGLGAMTVAPSVAAAQQRAPDLSDVPVSDMTIAEAEKELATITQAYNRKGHQVKQMALGTLLRFYSQKIVPCGSIVTSVRDCLDHQWPDLKNYPGHFLGPDENMALEPTIAQARMTEENYLDAVERLNMLLRAVRYESTLAAEDRYRDRLGAVISHLTELREAEFHNRLLYEKIFKIGGIILLLLGLSVGGMLVMKHIAQRNAPSSSSKK
ncbi:hypothetical protein [Thalassospira australica]|uniref:hypothetical protein n=1 Tax=Thalassospira australica TaxID=1528106 RepID=UPI00051A3487|nr:hypothetical protein [Thalassospira australica]